MEDQQTPLQVNDLDNFFNLAFDESTRANVRKAALWARICALCAFIGYGVVLIVAFFGRQGYLPDSEEGARINSMVRTTSVVTVLITAAIGVFINYVLYRFATATVRGMDAMDNISTNEGFNQLRRYFRIYGILLIIVLSFVVLGFLYAVISGVGSGA
ncbi:hypothetical protein [Puia sp.]|jgi:membrane protein YqaA with SNARE-associated domain|uniref:hypothetical protein n=1 Tax=Puia sp. TaxID=2045100 RepID=UPI002F415138